MNSGGVRQLAQGGRGGTITSLLAGRKVDKAYPCNGWLMLRFMDGHEARIGYQDVKGNRILEEPFINGRRSSIQLLTGQVVAGFLSDGLECGIAYDGGGETWFFWRDAEGNQVRGEPFLENLDVRVVLPSAVVEGVAHRFFNGSN